MPTIPAIAQAMLGTDAVAHVWTNNADGSPQVSVVWVVAQGDEKRLTGVSGVGKKTASRLLLELGNRLDEFMPESGGQPPAAGGRESDPSREEALLALTALGMSSVAAQAALAGIEDDGLAVEDMIKLALSGERG